VTGTASDTAEDTPASPELDCLTCGACCFQRPGTILVSDNDLVRWKRAGQEHILERLTEGHFGHSAFAMGPSGGCVHHGTAEEPHACQIYADRGDTCRDFEAGSWQCLEFRRDRGIDPPLAGEGRRRR
jgi:Fe-S-cluster containining protein